eukprot:1070290-Pleurochrysis_carterae.AAC.1
MVIISFVLGVWRGGGSASPAPPTPPGLAWAQDGGYACGATRRGRALLALGAAENGQHAAST